MPSPFSDKNALYLLTILEALEKIKIYGNGFDTAESLFEAKDQCPTTEFVTFFLQNPFVHLRVLRVFE